MALFIEDECSVYKMAKVQSSILYNAYADWCRTNNYKPHSSKNFKHEMERLGHFHKKDEDCNRFLGVELFVSPKEDEDSK